MKTSWPNAEFIQMMILIWSILCFELQRQQCHTSELNRSLTIITKVPKMMWNLGMKTHQIYFSEKFQQLLPAGWETPVGSEPTILVICVPRAAHTDDAHCMEKGEIKRFLWVSFACKLISVLVLIDLVDVLFVYKPVSECFSFCTLHFIALTYVLWLLDEKAVQSSIHNLYRCTDTYLLPEKPAGQAVAHNKLHNKLCVFR